MSTKTITVHLDIDHQRWLEFRALALVNKTSANRLLVAMIHNKLKNNKEG